MTDTRSASLAQLLAEQACVKPRALALEVRGTSLAGETTTYAALATRISGRAAALSDLQLPEGAILSLAAPATELFDALLASLWAGHAFLPLDPAIADSRCSALEAQSPQSVHRLACPPQPIGDGTHPAAVDPDAAAVIIATSGSEGFPKGVVLPHRALLAAAAASRSGIPLTAGDTWLDCLPLTHIGGLSIVWRCFQAGAAVLLHERFSASAVWADLASGRASHVSLVPPMLAQLLDAAGESPVPETLRCVLVGGAALSRPLYERARAAGWPLHVSYGMTETAAQIAMLPATAAWHEGMVGHALPGVGLAISSDGRIRVRGPQRMLGYLGELPAGPEEWLTTGDLGSLDASGALTVIGRADDILVSGGRNLHPTEIEASLIHCPGVKDAAVTASHDPVWGDVITALVVGSAAPDSIADWCREHLPSSLRPRRILRVDVLPRNGMGKLERRHLPELLAAAQP